jgi:hypothetical protein
MQTNDQSSAYFFFGSAYGGDSGPSRQYGLYNFVVGRFVLVHHDQMILNTVKKLFSSRYHLILCALHTAQNFSDNLIDNSVCYNWAIHNASSLRATRFPEFDIDAFPCELLMELDEFDKGEQIWKDREYFWMAACYVALLTKDIARLGRYHSFISEELPIYASKAFGDIDSPNAIFQLRHEIYRQCYQIFDFAKAETKIQLLVKNFHANHYSIGDLSRLDLSIDRT